MVLYKALNKGQLVTSHGSTLVDIKVERVRSQREKETEKSKTKHDKREFRLFIYSLYAMHVQQQSFGLGNREHL